MSPVKDIEFTQIAADWNSITLGEENPQALLAIRNGLTTKQDQGSGDYKVSRIETISGGWIDETRVRFASDLKEEDVEKYRIQKGDILFSHINSDPHLGKTGFAERDYEELLHGMNLLLIRANPEVFEAEFLNRVFQYYRDIGVFISICSRSVNQSSINQAKLKAVEVPLPPLPEQKKIAHILSTVQRAIEAQERIIQTTTELKKALMHKLFTEGLRNEPQKQTEIGRMPESWEVVELGSLAKVGNGSTPKRANEAYWEGGTIPWLNSTKIHDRFITEADQFVTPQAVKECHLPKVAPNSLLIAITGQGKTLGNSAITRIETCINQHLAYAKFHSAKIIPDFVLWFMQTRYDYLRAIAHGGGSTKGALTCGFLKAHPIPVPSRAEQEEIATTFQTLEDKQHFAVRKQAALQDLFRSLLHQLMTAKTRVQELGFSV
ncbi:MAG: restriction endonuclease subunit S [Candidatus Accumulibacter propinquus]|jgi:restriction endonuclease S subunit|uniref:restriction endonuclease subunit S n=1 Tax=Candidatus Accumulibacter propinquus TaxID=2954380 RepID=UPI002FC37974